MLSKASSYCHDLHAGTISSTTRLVEPTVPITESLIVNDSLSNTSSAAMLMTTSTEKCSRTLLPTLSPIVMSNGEKEGM